MPVQFSLSLFDARKLGVLRAALLLGLGGLTSGRAAVSNPELDGMLAKLPDPSKWKESPLQDALDPATHDPDLARVQKAFVAGDYAGALRLMHAVAARYPSHPTIQFIYGQLALRLKSYAEAERAFRAVASNRRSAAVGWFFTGATQFRENRPRDAARSTRQCLREDPPPLLAASAWTNLAYYELLSGNRAESIAAAQQGTKLAPTNGFSWAIRGFCEAGSQHYDAAIADYELAITLNPRLAIAYEGLGGIYARTKRPADAIAPLKTVLALAPRNYIAATQLGYCYLRTGQPADGARCGHQALAVQPSFSNAWDLLGLCDQQLGRSREALDAFRQAVRTGPENKDARAHLDQAARLVGTRS